MPRPAYSGAGSPGRLQARTQDRLIGLPSSAARRSGPRSEPGQARLGGRWGCGGRRCGSLVMVSSTWAVPARRASVGDRARGARGTPDRRHRSPAASIDEPERRPPGAGATASQDDEQDPAARATRTPPAGATLPARAPAQLPTAAGSSRRSGGGPPGRLRGDVHGRRSYAYQRRQRIELLAAETGHFAQADRPT